MIYLRHLLILSLLISNNYLLAEESQKSCLNLIKQNQCLQAIEACKVEAENNDPNKMPTNGNIAAAIQNQINTAISEANKPPSGNGKPPSNRPVTVPTPVISIEVPAVPTFTTLL